MILVTSDLHLSDVAKDSYRHGFMAWFADQAKEYKAGHILILGDLTQSKEGHSAWLVNKVVEHIYNLAQICPVIILRGNHDYLKIDSPFFAFLNQIENVSWINNPTVRKVEGLNCLFLPHSRNYKKDWEGWLDKPYDWVFAHNTFEGADAGNGRKLSGIPQSIFLADARVISGDVHVPQDLGQVTYCGSPFRINFGDNYNPSIIFIEGETISTLGVPGPYKHLVEISSIEDLINLKDYYPKDILKVRVNLTQGQYDNWHEIKAKIEAWGVEKGFIIDQVQPKVLLPNRIRRQKVGSKADDKELIQSYVKRRSASEEVLETGLEIMERSDDH